MNSKSSPKSAADRFWDKVIDRLLQQGVKAQLTRWYVIRAEQYLKAFPDRRLVEHTADDVTHYLEKMGRNGEILDWQFVQVVDAIQNLFLTADLTMAVDWDFWRASARSLAVNHPTIAQEHSEPLVSGQRFKKKRNAASMLDQIRERYPQVLERLLTEIRRRHYSIRTEQSYEAWVCRFVLFCEFRDPETLGAEDMVRFLEDLAVRGKVPASTQNQALNALVFFYQQA